MRLVPGGEGAQAEGGHAYKPVVEASPGGSATGRGPAGAATDAGPSRRRARPAADPLPGHHQPPQVINPRKRLCRLSKTNFISQITMFCSVPRGSIPTPLRHTHTHKDALQPLLVFSSRPDLVKNPSQGREEV